MSFNNFKYNFCKNKRAERATLDEQIEKAAEELDEVRQALGERNKEDVLLELMDVAYCVEGCLRKFSDCEVNDALRKVRQKAIDRDDLA